MKAIRVHEFGAPEVMKLEEIPDPSPGAGEVLVRIHAAGVNPFDTYVRSGTYAIKPPLPYTPGTDGAGVVEAVGDGVAKFKPGDRVYTAGALSGVYAEKALCREAQIHRLPPEVSYGQGAGVNTPCSAAFRALFPRARVIPGDPVLIHGASGGVGLAAVQLARAAGLTVLGTAGTEGARALVAGQGAHLVFDHRAADSPARILAATEGRGVDVILEMLANVNLGKDLTLLGRGGRVVVIGSRGTVEINPRDAMAREASILGLLLWNATDQELASIHAGLGAGLENGTLRPVVGKEIPLSEAATAHRAVMESTAFGKIVLVP
jgi:NADPH2:quinone reductase